MSARRRLAAGLGVGVLAVALAGVVILLNRPGPFQGRFERIQEGMTLGEVYAIMEPYPAIMASYEGLSDDGLRSTTLVIWEEDGERTVSVEYEVGSRRVVRKAIQGRPLGPLDQLRALLRRLGF